MIPAPPQIPDYSITPQDFLGEGTYGWVWRAVYKADQPRAVKVFKKKAIQEALWETEYEKLRGLDEPPGIVTLYDRGRLADGTPWYAMRLMADELPGGAWIGRTLARAMEHGLLDEDGKWGVLNELAETLAFMHRHGVVHCDLKPSNILLSNAMEPRPVICDFGQSRSTGALEGAAFGTVFYSSPQQLLSPERSQKHWDVYSFGAVAFELLSGRLPRLAEQLVLQKAHQSAEGAVATLMAPRDYSTELLSTATPLEEVVAELKREAQVRLPGEAEESGRLEEWKLVLQCLNIEENLRPGDMETAWELLQGCSRQRVLRRERRKRLIYAALAAISMAGGGVALWQRHLAQDRQAEAERERQAAVHAKTTAEGLINEMLFGLRNKLEPLGKVQLLDDVSRAAENYYAGIATGQLTPKEERNRGVMFLTRGLVLQAMGNLTAARGMYEQSLAIASKLAADNPKVMLLKRDLARSHESIAGIDLLQGNLPGALAAYTQSLKILEPLAGAHPANHDVNCQLAGLHQSIGELREKQLDSQAALESYRLAEAIVRRELAGSPQDARLNWQLSGTLRSTAAIHLLRLNLPGAIKASQEALGILRRLTAEDPGNLHKLGTLAEAYLNLGTALHADGKTEEAITASRDAASIAKRLAAADPANIDWLQCAVAADQSLAKILLSIGEMKEGADAARRAVAAQAQLTRHDPANTEYQRNLSVCLHTLCDFLANETKWTELLGHAGEMVRIDQRLVDGDPANGDCQQNLALSLNQQALALGFTGKLAEALDPARRSTALFEKLHAIDQTDTETLRGLSAAHLTAGALSLLSLDINGMLRGCRRSIEIFDKLVALDPSAAAVGLSLAGSGGQYAKGARTVFGPMSKIMTPAQRSEAAEILNAGVAAFSRLRDDVRVSQSAKEGVRAVLSILAELLQTLN